MGEDCGSELSPQSKKKRGTSGRARPRDCQKHVQRLPLYQTSILLLLSFDWLQLQVDDAYLAGYTYNCILTVPKLKQQEYLNQDLPRDRRFSARAGALRRKELSPFIVSCRRTFSCSVEKEALTVESP